MKSILAPLDGTEAAEAGLAWVQHAASQCGAAVNLLTVIEEMSPDSNGRLETAESYLRARRDIITAEGLTVSIEVVVGPAAEQILHRASLAELTVMTYGTSRWLFGGALDMVMREMTQPLVIVRAAHSQTASRPETHKMLVPMDMAAHSDHVLPVALTAARALGVSIVLCHVVAPIGIYRDPAQAPPGVARALEEMQDEAHRILASRAAQLERDGVSTEVLVVTGEVHREILRIAAASEASLIAMATRGNGSLSRVLGSVAYAVVQSTHLPCLLIRPPAA